LIHGTKERDDALHARSHDDDRVTATVRMPMISSNQELLSSPHLTKPKSQVTRYPHAVTDN
jgi:hypothetical protein